MTINVYWACIGKHWMQASAPESVRSTLREKDIADGNRMTHIHRCPAFNDHLRNVFTLKSIYDYDLSFSGNSLGSHMYDQEFFDEMITVRSMENRFISYNMQYIFFTEEESLKTSFYEFPFLEDNDFTKKCIIFPGVYDIGKWFRNTELAFILKPEHNSLNIKQGDVYSYMRFHTDESINFIQFRYNNLLDEYKNDGFNMTFFEPRVKLLNYYKLQKNKKLILKEIKNNIVD